MNHFKAGIRAVTPIISGIIPFGAVMGSSFAEAKLSFWQAMFMNTSMYAGAAQLATVDLMKMDAAVVVVVATGLIINLRFLLYSASMSQHLQTSPAWVKVFCAFTLTDQSYATMSANEDKFSNHAEAIQFYIGTAVCMMVFWHGSVIAGYIFGNFAPASLSLDFAVPLSFLALLVPTLKTRGHMWVASVSGICSLLFFNLPFKTGLIVSALLSISVAWMIIQRKHR